MPNQLTPEEIERIEADAAKTYPIKSRDSYKSDNSFDYERYKIYDKRAGYMSAATKYELKAKALLEALEEIADLLLGEPSEVNVLDARLKARIAVEDYNHHQQL